MYYVSQKKNGFNNDINWYHFYSLVYLNSRIGFYRLKYLYPVILVIDNLLSGNTKKLGIVDGQSAIRPKLKVGLGICRTNADFQWNTVYNVFHRIFCCGNETIRR